MKTLTNPFFIPTDCHRVYYPKFKIAIKNWHLCAGNKFGGRGTCHADSGGPLQCRIRNRWYLAGITSFGSNCKYEVAVNLIVCGYNWAKNCHLSDNLNLVLPLKSSGAKYGFPDVYTKITYFLNWIKEKMKNEWGDSATIVWGSLKGGQRYDRLCSVAGRFRFGTLCANFFLEFLAGKNFYFVTLLKLRIVKAIKPSKYLIAWRR